MSEATMQASLRMLRNGMDRLKAMEDAGERSALLDQMRTITSRLIVDAVDTPSSSGREDLAGHQTIVRAYEEAVLAECAAPVFEPTATGVSDAHRLALRDFLRRTFPGEDRVEVVEAQTASIGFSKKTILARLEGQKALPGDVVVRLDQAVNFLGTSVLQEYGPVRLLHAAGVPAPAPLALEPTGDVLDHPFILFERKPGTLQGMIFFPPPMDETLARDLAGALAKIHTADIAPFEALGLPGTAEPFIDGEIAKFQADYDRLDATSPTIEAAFAWVRRNRALADGRRTIVHNDFSFHNFLIEQGRLTAVLDWEFVHIGNPAADLAYISESADKTIGFETFLAYYEEAGGTAPSERELSFYKVWAHIRFAIMCQQSEEGLGKGWFDDVKYAMQGVLFLRKSLIALGDILPALIEEEKAAAG